MSGTGTSIIVEKKGKPCNVDTGSVCDRTRMSNKFGSCPGKSVGAMVTIDAIGPGSSGYSAETVDGSNAIVCTEH